MFDHLKGRKLYRQPKDALIFGVAAGFAQYIQVDVVFVRLILVALAFLTGWWPVLLVYIVAMVLLPIDPSQETVPSQQEPKDVTPPTEEPEQGKPSESEHMDREQNV